LEVYQMSTTTTTASQRRQRSIARALDRAQAQSAIGQHVTWRYEPRGGYGYVIPVNGVVVAVRPTRIQIEVERYNGEMVKRWVTPDRIRPKATATMSRADVYALSGKRG
jgi:hypothetical protein